MSDLKRLRSLANSLQQRKAALSLLEVEVKRKKEDITQLVEREIPDAMDDVGLEEFTTDEGFSVTIATKYYAGLSVDRIAAGHAWLRERGFGSLIKTLVSVQFGRGDEDAATELFRSLVENNFDVSKTDKVHPQTLKAFVKEQIEAGTALPLETFGVHIIRGAVIKSS